MERKVFSSIIDADQTVTLNLGSAANLLVIRTSSDTFFAPSFFIARDRFTSTDFSLTSSAAAIFLFDTPRTTRAKTCRSRGVRVSTRLATAQVCNPLAVSLRCGPDCAQQFGFVGGFD